MTPGSSGEALTAGSKPASQGLSTRKGGWWQQVHVQEHVDQSEPSIPSPRGPGWLCTGGILGTAAHLQVKGSGNSAELAPVNPAFENLFHYTDMVTLVCPRG